MSTSDYDHGETVNRLLAEAEELTAGAENLDEVLKDDNLQSLAVEARNLIEGAEPAELLDAIGLEVSRSDPSGLVRALAEADAEPLIRLRRLQLLASVARDEGDDREAIGEFEALSDVLDEGNVEIADHFDGDHVHPSDLSLVGGEPSEESADEDEEERNESEDMVEGAIDAAGEIAEVVEDVKSDDEEAANEDKEGEGAAEEDTGAAKQVHSALSDMVDQLQEKAPDDSTQDAPGEEEELDEDEGNESSGSSRHSTIPSSDRADMRVPSRHSTMSE